MNHLMTKYDYHQNGHKEIVFALAVHCFAHYAAVTSTWVYVAHLSPHAKNKKKKESKED